jgi:hypothetical protein
MIPPLLLPQKRTLALLLEPTQLLLRHVYSHVRESVLLRPPTTALHHFFRLRLQLLQLASLLDTTQIPSQQGVHVLESSDLLVAQTSGADAGTQAEGT